jgi:HSP20 family protein
MYEMESDDLLDGPEGFRSDIERFFTHFSQWKHPQAFFEKAWKPHCDVYESEECYHVVLELSGVSEESVEVLLQGRTLVVRGERPSVRNPHYQTVHLMEINFGRFERALELPQAVDQDRTTATYRQGFLIVELPKLGRGKSRDIRIVQT